MRAVSGEHLAPDSISVRPADGQVAAQLALLCTSDSVAELRQNSADLNILVGVVQIDDTDWMESLERTACTEKRLCLRAFNVNLDEIRRPSISLENKFVQR